MSDISVPSFFALSLVSVIAISAYSTADAVSPPRDCKRLAEKLVTVSIYALADNPEVLYAPSAYFITLSELVLKSVSTPPTSCSYSA